MLVTMLKNIKESANIQALEAKRDARNKMRMRDTHSSIALNQQEAMNNALPEYVTIYQ